MTAAIPARPEPWGAEALAADGTVREIDRCLEELAQLAQTECSAQAFYAALLDRALRVLPSAGGAAWHLVPGRRVERLSQHRFPLPLAQRPSPPVPDGAAPLVVPAYARQSAGYQFNHPYPWPLVACLVPAEGGSSVLIEIALDEEAGADVQSGAAQLVGVLAEIAADFHRRGELAQLRGREGRLGQFAEMVGRLHAHLDPHKAAYVMANDGRQWIGCDRVSVLRLRHRRAVTLAVSAVDRVDRQSTSIAALEALASAVAASGEPIVWQESTADELPPQLSNVLHAFLDIGHARQLAAVLLCPADGPSGPLEPTGVLVAESFVAEQSLATLHNRALEVARAGGTALSNALAHHSLPLLALQQRLSKAGQALSRRPLAATAAGLGLAIVIALLAVVPADFSVPADGSLQPQVRRNLFAPADGVVSEVLVEHGERVAKGQVLLRIRNPALDLEHSRLDGELQTAQARLDAVRAMRSRSDTSQAIGERDRLASEEEQLKQEVRGLESQLLIARQLRTELDIASPLSGVVLTWNTHQQLADRPVKQGHALLAVADPAGPWALELNIQDAEVGHVLAGRHKSDAKAPVRFLLASDPAVTHHARLDRLALATDLADGQVAAPAIAVLDDAPPEGVRAGARVTARIHCGSRSIGYVWLHDFIDFVRTSLLF